jgi:uncharacterized protein
VRAKSFLGGGALLLAVAALVFTIDYGLSRWAASRPPVLTPAESAFLTAARRGDVAGLKAGLANGVDVNVVEPAYGRTALMRAAAFGQVQAVQLLLASGADLRVADRDKWTVLHIAAEADVADVIALLPATAADQGALCLDRSGGSAPLGLAVRAGHLGAVRALLAGHADPSFVEPGELSPLERAIKMGRVDLAGALLSARPSLTPSPKAEVASILHLAVARCDWAKVDIVKQLVEAGADPRARDSAGHTPLEDVESKDAGHQSVTCYPPIADYLRSVGGER